MSEYWDILVSLEQADPAIGATRALGAGLRRMTQICRILLAHGYCSVEENRKLRAANLSRD